MQNVLISLHTSCNRSLQQKCGKSNLHKTLEGQTEGFGLHPLLQSRERDGEFYLLVEELKLRRKSSN